MTCRYIYIPVLLFLTCCISYPQQINLPPDFILEKRIIIPGEEYKAGSLHEFFFGEHWRNLWITPIEVPVLNLQKFAGGIKAVKRGGGFQTKSLRFENKSGIQYKFRSLDKDPRKTLPEELQETIAADVLKDQISTSNPVAALVAVPILNAVNILQAEPILCILPDDENLGEFRAEFANLSGMMEVHPDVDEDDNITFAGAEKVEGTFDLFDRFEKDNDETVNSAEYLKARLIDIFLGDWDRHTDQWRWARFTINDKKTWLPIPRDRDQAFAKYDGFFPWMAAIAIPQLEGFSESYPEIEDLTWSGRHIDRRFLIQLSKEEWDSVTQYVTKRLTDSLIEYAVKRLPPEMYAASGEELTSELKSRRDHLAEASEIFFSNTLRYVDIRGSNKDEYAEIIRIDNENVEVNLYNKDKAGEKEGKPFFHKVYNDKYVKEVRLLLLNGDDKALVKGKVDSGIPVYISGDEGKDELIDSSLVEGYLLGFIPFISSAEKKTYFYDTGKKTIFTCGSSTSIRDKHLPEPKDNFEKYEPQIRTWGHDWKFAPWLGINPDDGLFIGGGPILYEFGFLTDPYVYRMELVAGFATYPKKFRVRYLGEFNSILDNNRIMLEVKSSGLEVLNFFGFGNNSQRLSDLEKNGFYKAKQHQDLVLPRIEFKTGTTSNIYLGYRFLYSNTDLQENTLIKEQKPYGTDNMVLHSLTAEFIYDSRDHNIIPQKGILFNSAVSYYGSLKKNISSFYKLRGSITGFVPLFSLPYSTAALRLSGEKLWGHIPYFEAAFLGGLESLRGFERNRFAGDASLYANAELRIFLTKFKLLVPIYLGTAVFGDAGRVFAKSIPDESKKWHRSFGAGLWFSFIYPDLLVSAYAAFSDDDEGFYFTGGFAF